MLQVSLFSLSVCHLQEVVFVRPQTCCEAEWVVVLLCVPWNESDGGRLSCHRVHHPCRSPAFCRRDTVHHDDGPCLYLCLYPLACPSPFLCRRRILIY